MATPRLLRTQGSSMLSCRYRTKQPSSTIVVLHPEGLTVDISDTVTDVTGWDGQFQWSLHGRGSIEVGG